VADEDNEEGVDNLRQIPELRALLGLRLVDITSADRDELADGDYLCLHFENGTTIRVPVGAMGFDIEPID
jgi:hypothetical protein